MNHFLERCSQRFALPNRKIIHHGILITRIYIVTIKIWGSVFVVFMRDQGRIIIIATCIAILQRLHATRHIQAIIIVLSLRVLISWACTGVKMWITSQVFMQFGTMEWHGRSLSIAKKVIGDVVTVLAFITIISVPGHQVRVRAAHDAWWAIVWTITWSQFYVTVCGLIKHRI